MFKSSTLVTRQDKPLTNTQHKNTTKTPCILHDHCNHHKTHDVRQSLGDPKLGSKNEFHPHFFSLRQRLVMLFHVRHSFELDLKIETRGFQGFMNNSHMKCSKHLRFHSKTNLQCLGFQESWMVFFNLPYKPTYYSCSLKYYRTCKNLMTYLLKRCVCYSTMVFFKLVNSKYL
jgi:hypothetical protein